MNWIGEIKRFYARQMVFPLSPQAQALWHYLMNCANTCYWDFPLVLRIGAVAGTLGMSGTAVKNARKELIDGGYIIHEKQTGSKPAKYTVISYAASKIEEGAK